MLAYQLDFVSDFWVNLHHVLYAGAWARRGDKRSLAGALPAPLECAEKEWLAAIDYYDRNIADRQLLFDRKMHKLGLALIKGDPTDALKSVAPIYRAQFWNVHDRANQEWIDDVIPRINSLAPQVVPVLESAFGESWPDKPVRTDVVWVGTREGGYTSSHITVSSGDPTQQKSAAAEIVFHEAAHLMVNTVQRKLRKHSQLWHVVLFYVVGEAVRWALDEPYTPYAYATGLFDRAWPNYRPIVEKCWTPFFDGRIDGRQALARTKSAVPQAPQNRS